MIAPTYPCRPVNGGNKPLSLPGFAFEPKANGFRVLVHNPTSTCFNRHGELLSIADSFSVALSKLRKEVPFDWVDCEGLERRHGLAKGTLLVLDLPQCPGSYEQRRRVMQRFLEPCCTEPTLVPGNEIRILPSLMDSIEKPKQSEWAWDVLQLNNDSAGCQFWEGLVYKRLNSEYNLQLVSPDQTTSAWVKTRWAW